MRMRSFALVPLLAVLLVACQGAERSGQVQDGPGGPDAVRLTMVDNAFEPETLELPAGTEVAVEVANEGSAVHDFTIEDPELSTGAVNAGDVVTATFTVPEGTTEFGCTIHGGMDGRIVGR